jgi:NAD+ kinase
MLEESEARPVFGMNRGTFGFLMNEWRLDRLHERIQAAKHIRVTPLVMEATDIHGKTCSHPRSTRSRCFAKPARLRRSRFPSTAASSCRNWWRMECWSLRQRARRPTTFPPMGPILPLAAKMLTLTSISPFRPRRWSGAILPDDVAVRFRVLEAEKRRWRRLPTSSKFARSAPSMWRWTGRAR